MFVQLCRFQFISIRLCCFFLGLERRTVAFCVVVNVLCFIWCGYLHVSFIQIWFFFKVPSRDSKRIANKNGVHVRRSFVAFLLTATIFYLLLVKSIVTIRILFSCHVYWSLRCYLRKHFVGAKMLKLLTRFALSEDTVLCHVFMFFHVST